MLFRWWCCHPMRCWGQCRGSCARCSGMLFLWRRSIGFLWCSILAGRKSLWCTSGRRRRWQCLLGWRIALLRRWGSMFLVLLRCSRLVGRRWFVRRWWMLGCSLGRMLLVMSRAAISVAFVLRSFIVPSFCCGEGGGVYLKVFCGNGEEGYSGIRVLVVADSWCEDDGESELVFDEVLDSEGVVFVELERYARRKFSSLDDFFHVFYAVF